jgi:hypothetical protein
MQSENRYFNTACTLIGLIVLISGIWLAVEAIWIYMHETDCRELYRRLWVPDSIVETIVHVDGFNRHNLLLFLGILAARGVLPAMLGYYLMKTGNSLLRFADGNQQVEPIENVTKLENPHEEMAPAFSMGQASFEPNELKHFMGTDDDALWRGPGFK